MAGQADRNESLPPAQGDAGHPSLSADRSDAAISQDEIESLLSAVSQKTGEVAADASATAAKPPSAASIADAQRVLGADEIQRLLAEGGLAPAQGHPPEAAGQAEGQVNQGDIECLLKQAEDALRSIDSESDGLPPGAMAFQFQELGGTPPTSESATLDLLSDVELDLKIELGRTHMYLEDVLKLRRGAVVPLDKLAGDPVDIYVNERLIARGEVLVLNDNFCVRVAELIAGAGLE